MRKKLSHGQIKFFAHQSMQIPFGMIPIFLDNGTNRAIDDHRTKIISAKTKKCYNRQIRRFWQAVETPIKWYENKDQFPI